MRAAALKGEINQDRLARNRHDNPRLLAGRKWSGSDAAGVIPCAPEQEIQGGLGPSRRRFFRRASGSAVGFGLPCKLRLSAETFAETTA
jgi:hypothetical protein